jgi:hypothetical protein
MSVLYRDDFDSSNIESIAYEKNARSLYVTFKSTAVYLYEGVIPEVVSSFLAAPSKGQYFGANIRRGYPTRRLGSEEIEQLRRRTGAVPLGESGAWLIAVLSTARQAGRYRELLF